MNTNILAQTSLPIFQLNCWFLFSISLDQVGIMILFFEPGLSVTFSVLGLNSCPQSLACSELQTAGQSGIRKAYPSLLFSIAAVFVRCEFQSQRKNTEICYFDLNSVSAIHPKKCLMYSVFVIAFKK